MIIKILQVSANISNCDRSESTAVYRRSINPSNQSAGSSDRYEADEHLLEVPGTNWFQTVMNTFVGQTLIPVISN